MRNDEVEEITYYNKQGDITAIEESEHCITKRIMTYDEAVERYGTLDFDLIPNVKFKYNKPKW